MGSIEYGKLIKIKEYNGYQGIDIQVGLFKFVNSSYIFLSIAECLEQVMFDTSLNQTKNDGDGCF